MPKCDRFCAVDYKKSNQEKARDARAQIRLVNYICSSVILSYSAMYGVRCADKTLSHVDCTIFQAGRNSNENVTKFWKRAAFLRQKDFILPAKEQRTFRYSRYITPRFARAESLKNK